MRAAEAFWLLYLAVGVTAEAWAIFHNPAATLSASFARVVAPPLTRLAVGGLAGVVFVHLFAFEDVNYSAVARWWDDRRAGQEDGPRIVPSAETPTPDVAGTAEALAGEIVEGTADARTAKWMAHETAIAATETRRAADD